LGGGEARASGLLPGLQVVLDCPVRAVPVAVLEFDFEPGTAAS
jgi:hypothetical protein